MSLFANYRADRLIAEVKSSGNPGSPLAQKALEKLVALGPSAIEPIVDALNNAENHRSQCVRHHASAPFRKVVPLLALVSLIRLALDDAGTSNR